MAIYVFPRDRQSNIPGISVSVNACKYLVLIFLLPVGKNEALNPLT